MDTLEKYSFNTVFRLVKWGRIRVAKRKSVILKGRERKMFLLRVISDKGNGETKNYG